MSKKVRKGKGGGSEGPPLLYGVKCYHSHPELQLGSGVFYGGNCAKPKPGYDIYVGLDWSMKRTGAAYPWNESKVVEIYFPVTDGNAPADAAEFKRGIGWLAAELERGKRVHAGCLGGHGRTGTLLAALVSVVHGSPNAGEWVRENYCKSAIETTAQVQFLQKHFGIVPVVPSRHQTTSAYPVAFAQNVIDLPEASVSRLDPIPCRSIWSEWVCGES